MKHFTAYILLISVYLFNVSSSQEDIMSGEELDFGNWYPWDFCPSGSFANAFEVEAKVEEPGTLIQDGRGMTGMRLFCAADATHNETIISSHYSIGAGTWRGKKICPPGDYLTGFRFRLEPKQGWNHDDTAGNDVDMMCSSGIELSGGGNIRGSWNSWVNCTLGTAVCGLQTKMEEEKFLNIDKVSLVSVRLHCCSLSGNPIQAKSIVFPASNENDNHSAIGQQSKGAVEPLQVESGTLMSGQGSNNIPIGHKVDAIAPKPNETHKHDDATHVNHDFPNLHNETSSTSSNMSHPAGSTNSTDGLMNHTDDHMNHPDDHMNHPDDHMNHPDDHMNHPVDPMNHPVDPMNHPDGHMNTPDGHMNDHLPQNPKVEENKVN